MTDYKYWSKFDDIEVSKIMDADDDFKSAKTQVIMPALKHGEKNVSDTKKISEVINSKNIVNLLLSKKKAKRNKEIADNNPSFTSHNEESPLAKAFISVGKYLSNLLGDVQDFTELSQKLHRHCQGYHTTLRCIRELAILSSIKIEVRRKMDTDNYRTTNVTHILDDLEVAEVFIAQQAVGYTALFALSIGKVGLAADASRSVLRFESSSESITAGMWAVRGLAFGAMGSVYLMKLHLQRALRLFPKYPGLADDTLWAMLEDAERNHARHCATSSNEAMVLESIQSAIESHFRSLHVSKFVSADLSRVGVAEVTAFARCNIQAQTVCAAPCVSEGALHADDVGTPSADCTGTPTSLLQSMDITQDIRRVVQLNIQQSGKLRNNNSRHFTLITKFQAVFTRRTGNPEIFVLYELCLDLFYQAQILNLESSHFSARHKYWAAAVLADGCLRCAADEQHPMELSAHIEEIKSTLLVLKASCFLNVAASQIASRSFPSNSFRHATMELYECHAYSLTSLVRLSTEELCQRAVEVCNSPTTLIKAAMLLDKRMRLDQSKSFYFRGREVLNASEFRVNYAFDKKFLVVDPRGTDSKEDWRLSQKFLPGFDFAIVTECEDLEESASPYDDTKEYSFLWGELIRRGLRSVAFTAKTI